MSSIDPAIRIRGEQGDDTPERHYATGSLATMPYPAPVEGVPQDYIRRGGGNATASPPRRATSAL